MGLKSNFLLLLKKMVEEKQVSIKII